MNNRKKMVPIIYRFYYTLVLGHNDKKHPAYCYPFLCDFCFLYAMLNGFL